MIERPRAAGVPLPAPVPPPQRAGMPWIAALAPLAVAGIAWVVTGSAFVLLLALASPVLVIAGHLDGVRRRRRDIRAARARMLDRIAHAEELLRQAADAERRRLADLAPPPCASSTPTWSDAGPARVRLGDADLRAPAAADPHDEASEVAGALASLRRRAAVLAAAPIVADATAGIGVAGPECAARAVARSVALQLALRLPPERASLVAPPDERWAGSLPHRVAPGPPGCYAWADADRTMRVEWAADPAVLSPGLGLVLESDGVRAILRPDPERAVGEVALRGVAHAEAETIAVALAAAADRHGRRPPEARLPDRAELGALLAGREPNGPGSLAVPIGVGADGPVVVDLAADGPHALIAGTTGSGKSELLATWALALAATASPAELALLLVDFKGGATFAPLAGLPHVLEVVSDLDPVSSARTIGALRAELRRREALLAERAARSVDDLRGGGPPRLVVMVDEFAALVAEQPGLHEVFADLAARGRSLGIHLVLCTQRPAGVVRDAVLANVALRISLRVGDPGDSRAVLGVDDAAGLPTSPRGRALLRTGDGVLCAFQVAIAEIEAIATEAARRGDRATTPWPAPLPSRLPRSRLAAVDEGFPYALVDLPAELRQETLALRARDGGLLVIGGPGAGTTTALETLAAAAGETARWLPSEPAELWWALRAALERPDREVRLLLLDDVDAVLARADPDLRADLGEALARLVRDSPARGTAVALAAKRLGGPLQQLAAVSGDRVLLRMPSREEHVLAGGDLRGFDPRRRPGSGQRLGDELQIAIGDPAPRIPAAVPPVVRVAPGAGGRIAIVTPSPGRLASRLAARCAVALVGDGRAGDPDAADVLMGDPDAWQAEWALLTRIRRERPMLVRGTPADLRAIARVRDAPPLGEGEWWLVAEGEVRRAVLDRGAHLLRAPEGPAP